MPEGPPMVEWLVSIMVSEMSLQRDNDVVQVVVSQDIRW